MSQNTPMNKTFSWVNKTITHEDAERDLAKHHDEYYEAEFVPFPTVDAAVEAVTETAGWTYMDEGAAFVAEVARRLKEWVDDYHKQWEITDERQ